MVSTLVSGARLRVQALAGDTVLCSWVDTYSHSASLHSEVFKWVPGNVMLRCTSILSRGSKNTLSHFMLQKPR